MDSIKNSREKIFHRREKEKKETEPFLFFEIDIVLVLNPDKNHEIKKLHVNLSQEHKYKNLNKI